MLDILYLDSHIVIINKPHGLLVHQSPIARDASEFAIQMLRNQLHQKVYPVHRIDRKTSGILIFALDKESNRLLTEQFTQQSIKKTYLAVVRGFIKENTLIDYALRREDGKIQEAQTYIRPLKYAELPIGSANHTTSRYTLIEAEPHTGRMHQIRKHMAHIFHPIIGDRPHGCNKQNKLWLEHFSMNTMLLHASHITFIHPISQEIISMNAPLQSEFTEALKILNIEM